MVEYVKYNGSLENISTDKIRNYADLDAVTLAINNGELQEGDLFTTICTAQGVTDDIASIVYRIQAAMPDSASCDNKLATMNALHEISDSKIDDVMMNGSYLPKSCDSIYKFGMKASNLTTGEALFLNPTTLQPMTQLESMVNEIPIRSNSGNYQAAILGQDGCIYSCWYTPSGSHREYRNSLPFVYDGNHITLTNEQEITAQELQECIANSCIYFSSGMATDLIQSISVDLGSIATSSAVSDLTGRITTLENTTLPDLCSCVSCVQEQLTCVSSDLACVETRVGNVEVVLDDPTGGLTSLVNDLYTCPGLNCVGTVTDISGKADCACTNSLNTRIGNLESCAGLNCTGTVVASQIANFITATCAGTIANSCIATHSGVDCTGTLTSANFSLSGTTLTIRI